MHRNNEFNRMAKQANQTFRNIQQQGHTPNNNPVVATDQHIPNTQPNDKPDMDTPLKPGPPVITNPNYLQGYLRNQIGKYMTVNFLLGTGTFVDKEGILKDVGIDHIVLEEVKTGDEVIADLYSIKFVEIPQD